MVCSRIIIIELLAIDFGIRLMDDNFEIIQMIFGFAALLLCFFPGRDLSDIAKSNTRLINFAWVSIPLVRLVYTSAGNLFKIIFRASAE